MFFRFFESGYNKNSEVYENIFRLECPIPVAEDLDFFSINGRTHDIEVFGADHEIHVAHRFVDAKAMELVLRIFIEIRIEVRKARAKGQMASGVFIVKGVIEKKSGIVDGRVVRNKRALSKISGAFIDMENGL